MKFDWVARVCEMIPTVKSVSSSEIYKISGFQPVIQRQITVLPSFRNIAFFSGFTVHLYDIKTKKI